MSSKITKIIEPTSSEVVKNRVFGMPTSKMTRHQRVSFTAMIKIAYDDLKQNPDQKLFEYDTKEFFKMIGITENRKQSHLFSNIFIDDDGWEQETDDYSLEKTLRSLLSKTVFFRFKDADGKTYKAEGATLLSDFKLTREKITFGFSEWVRSRIYITDNAYIMKLPIIASFKSGYAVTLFEQLEQRRSFNKWEISLKALRKIFGIDDDKYKRFTNFKSRVLNVAYDEIIEKTYYSLNYELVKDGRTISKIIFTWRINKTSFADFKEFIRKNFVNTPLAIFPGKDGSQHIIQVSESGKLYNAKNPELYYDNEKAKIIWKWMFENQHALKIKEIQKNEKFHDEDFTKYYGYNLMFDGELYEHIILIQRTALNNKLKIRFQSGEILVVTDEEFKKYVLFDKNKS